MRGCGSTLNVWSVNVDSEKRQPSYGGFELRSVDETDRLNNTPEGIARSAPAMNTQVEDKKLVEADLGVGTDTSYV